ncbi:unnamed protein product [Schistosoma margrebowiei]|uniref:Uncharacterized protein n=1 Tax=Schistosoma margrebowiei TaxID=48269 RepID=A0A183MU11_9TREM|nr:unnamed protein product [Schistosoma margrebowiei]
MGFVLLNTREQGVPVILKELVLPGGFDLLSSSFTVRCVTTELSEPWEVHGSKDHAQILPFCSHHLQSAKFLI